MCFLLTIFFRAGFQFYWLYLLTPPASTDHSSTGSVAPFTSSHSLDALGSFLISKSDLFLSLPILRTLVDHSGQALHKGTDGMGHRFLRLIALLRLYDPISSSSEREGGRWGKEAKGNK